MRFSASLILLPSYLFFPKSNCTCAYLQMKVPRIDDPMNKVSFKKFVLTQCQQEFEKDYDEELELERRKEEIDKEPDVSVAGISTHVRA